MMMSLHPPLLHVRVMSSPTPPTPPPPLVLFLTRGYRMFCSAQPQPPSLLPLSPPFPAGPMAFTSPSLCSYLTLFLANK